MKLERSEIHLWHTDQKDFSLEKLETLCLDWLNEDELRRYRRYAFDRHRLQFLLGRYLIRSVLSHYREDMASSDWEFVSNEYGKPKISPVQSDGSLFFNLSHSGEELVLAISPQENIGVDIELSNKPRRIERIASRYFSAKEVADLLALPESSRLARFYELWTLKEAYIKACGMGLAIPLQHFSYSFLEDSQLDISFDEQRQDNPESWRLWLFGVTGDYQLSLAVKLEKGTTISSISSYEFKGPGSVESRDLAISRRL